MVACRPHITSTSATPTFSGVPSSLWQTSDVYRSVFNDPASRRRAQQEHRRIIKACKAKDAETLITAMDEHRSNAIADLTGLLGEPMTTEPIE